VTRAYSGRDSADLTPDRLARDELSTDDVRIHPETLGHQAEVAERHENPQLAANFRRAAEMTAIPDAEVLAMYNALRPRASSGAALAELADRLETTYSAPVCAALVREAAEVYERRDLLARPAGDDD
jgi:propanediol dehydratase small subunit